MQAPATKKSRPTSADLPHIPPQHRPWLVAWEMGWSVEKIAETWSTRDHPLTSEEVQETLDNLSLDPYPGPTARAQLQHRVSHAPAITVADFQRLAKERGWTETWLTEQLRSHVDDPKRIAQELLSSEGKQRPRT